MKNYKILLLLFCLIGFTSFAQIPTHNIVGKAKEVDITHEEHITKRRNAIINNMRRKDNENYYRYIQDSRNCGVYFVINTNSKYFKTEYDEIFGNICIYLHIYDKNGEWVKRGIFRDAKCEAIEITPTQLNELNVEIIDFAQFVAANDKHAIWNEINKYERSGHPIYIIDVAEKTEDCIKLYPVLGFYVYYD